jgi:hypothetical protein
MLEIFFRSFVLQIFSRSALKILVVVSEPTPPSWVGSDTLGLEPDKLKNCQKSTGGSVQTVNSSIKQFLLFFTSNTPVKKL